YSYDNASRLTSLAKHFSLISTETTSFAYDAASRLDTMTYQTGAYAKYTYDERSRVKKIEHKNSNNSLITMEQNNYDAASRITSRVAGPTGSQVTTTFGYDDEGQLTSESDTSNYS